MAVALATAEFYQFRRTAVEDFSTTRQLWPSTSIGFFIPNIACSRIYISNAAQVYLDGTGLTTTRREEYFLSPSPSIITNANLFEDFTKHSLYRGYLVFCNDHRFAFVVMKRKKSSAETHQQWYGKDGGPTLPS